MKRHTQTLLFLVAAGLPLAAAQQTTAQTTPPTTVQAAVAPAPPTQYSGHGTIEQLNYDRHGAVNGFLMSDGVLVFTPPMEGTSTASEIRKGSTVIAQGMVHKTMSGRKVVDAQSLKIDDQTIVFAMSAPHPPPPPPHAPPPPMPPQ